MSHALKLLAAALIAVAPCAPASAQLTSDCLMMIDLLRPATGDAEITGPDATRMHADLLARLDAAAVAFSAGKAADAAKALIEYRARLGRLQAAGRISSIDAAPLFAGANEASACVQQGRT